MKTIVGLFDGMAEAKQAAHDLEAAGVAESDISLIAGNEGGRYAATDEGAQPVITSAGSFVGHDAKVGAEVGGVTGLLIGLTGFMIPGVGWLAGAGWLVATILGAGTGAVIGGLTGALADVGVPEEDAGHYNEGVRQGGILIAVRADDSMAPRVAQILGNKGAVNIDERAARYQQENGTPSGALAGN